LILRLGWAPFAPVKRSDPKSGSRRKRPVLVSGLLLVSGVFLFRAEPRPVARVLDPGSETGGRSKRETFAGSSLRKPGGTLSIFSTNSHAGSTHGWRQLPRAWLAIEDLRLPPDLAKDFPITPPAREIPGRRVPPLTQVSDLNAPGLASRVVPAPEANTLAHVHYQQRYFGRVEDPDGEIHLFNPEMVLVKFDGMTQVGVLHVAPAHELEVVQALNARAGVQFAELDLLQRRQFTPSDPQLTNQWQHAVIGSFQAWDKTLGDHSVRIAIVDTPFQMDHPDLAANTVSGWDMVTNGPVTSANGIRHSTMTAGMAAAVIDNLEGIAGAGNCQILPINIEGFTFEMYNAIIWAADHNVRVVNISFDGAWSPTLNDAGLYLRTRIQGILAMPGINCDTGKPCPSFLTYPNHPYIFAISMTDADDTMRSKYGEHIDFAAPGWNILSTTVGSGYSTDNGTSFSTPLFAGVVAVLFSINPELTAEETVNILKDTAVDKGTPGWDQFYGWGRINFAAAVDAAFATVRIGITNFSLRENRAVMSAKFLPGWSYTLWKTSRLAPAAWAPVTNAVLTTNGMELTLVDPTPENGGTFYRVQALKAK
jgi:hypothetical protein